MTREILNKLIDKFGFKRYLEIGVGTGVNLSEVACPYKIGIEPNLQAIRVNSCKVYEGTSDDIFNSKEFIDNESDGFDLVFVDGLHKFRQAVRDVENSLNFLNYGGIIVCHDVYPFDYLDKYDKLVDVEYPGPHRSWTGDVWKLIFYVRFCMLNLDFRTINNFPGYLLLCRISTPRKKECNFEDEFEFDINFIDNFTTTNAMIHKDLMNIVSIEELFKDV